MLRNSSTAVVRAGDLPYRSDEAIGCLADAALDPCVLRDPSVATRPMQDAAGVAFTALRENPSFASMATLSDWVRRAGHFFDCLYTIRVRRTRWDRSRVLVL